MLFSRRNSYRWTPVCFPSQSFGFPESITKITNDVITRTIRRCSQLPTSVRCMSRASLRSDGSLRVVRRPRFSFKLYKRVHGRETQRFQNVKLWNFRLQKESWLQYGPKVLLDFLSASPLTTSLKLQQNQFFKLAETRGALFGPCGTWFNKILAARFFKSYRCTKYMKVNKHRFDARWQWGDCEPDAKGSNG